MKTNSGSVENLFQENIKKLLLCRKRYEKAYRELKKLDSSKIDKDTEFEMFEKFTGRFTRLIEIFTNKILTSLWKVMNTKTDDESFTFRDYLHFAEKIGIINNIGIRIDMRNERNKLTHDYLFGELLDLYERTTEHYHKHIEQMIKNIKKYEIL